MLQMGLPAEFLVKYHTQNTHRRAEIIVELGRMRGQELLCFVFDLVKCMRIYFSGAQDAPCILAHTRYHSWTICIILQFYSINLPKGKAFTLSTKLVPKAERVGGLQASTRFAL